MLTPQELIAYGDSGEQWPALRADFGTLPEAYQSALAVRRLRIARGEIPRGYKIGFTNRTIWSRYQVFAPIWGSMWNSSVTECEGFSRISLAHLSQPRIEPEAVFGFKATPRQNASLADLFEALEWIAPGFEIVQSHLPDWKFGPAQTVADGGLHGKLLVGKKLPIADLAGDAEQLHQLLASTCLDLSRNGELIETGRGSYVLDSPLRALLHFLNELRSCPGAQDLVAGDIVTTGTWTDAWPVQAGEQWRSNFDQALPSLTIDFE